MTTDVASPWQTCPQTLSVEQVQTFHTQGYLAFKDALDEAEVALVCAQLERLVHETARHHGGVIKENKLRHPKGSCSLQFEAGTGDDALGAAEFELKVRKLMSYCAVAPVLDEMSRSHTRIQGVLRDLLGPDPILFQDMALIKPPKIGSIKPWHQDNAYFSVVPLDQIVGVWIALDNATIENGCMHVIPGGHLTGARRHYHDRDCEIVPDRIDESQAVPIELEAGGVLFFYGMLPHQTPQNHSHHRRRALQWHYRGAGTRMLTDEEYDAIFAEADGTPASCRAATEQR